MSLDADGATAPISNGPETAERATGGRFAPGNPGGPGRPKGTRHKALLALEAIGSEAAEEDASAGKGEDAAALS